MQLSNTILIVAAEVGVALLIGSVILVAYTVKLKGLIKRQQKKLVGLLNEVKAYEREAAERENAPPPPPPPPAPVVEAPSPEPARLYQDYVGDMLAATKAEFTRIAPDSDIEDEQQSDSSTTQRVLALRYAFLQTEKRSTNEVEGSESYWDLLQQSLEPLLSSNKKSADDVDVEELEGKVDAYKKRVESAAAVTIEKELVIYELEQQVQSQATTIQETESSLQLTKEELAALQDDLAEKEKILENHTALTEENLQLKETLEGLTLESKDMESNINSLDEENKALKQNIDNATQAIEEKDVTIDDLQKQLQQQTRSTQASEAAIQVLSDELLKTKEKVTNANKVLEEHSSNEEENKRNKELLNKLSRENKILISKLHALETENHALLQEKDELATEAAKPIENIAAVSSAEKDTLIQKLQQQLHQQTRTLQESETCVKILNDELAKLQKEASTNKEKSAGNSSTTSEENQRLKAKLHKLDQESKEIVSKLQTLETENAALKQKLESDSSEEIVSTSSIDTRQYKKMEAQLKDLQDQYAELEEKYLELQEGGG